MGPFLNKRETRLLLWILLPYSLVINFLIFEGSVLNPFFVFGKGLLYTTIYLFIIYWAFILVAHFIHHRIPAGNALFRRIAIMLPAFYVMNIVFIHSLFYIYNNIPSFSAILRPGMLWWTILFSCIVSTIITLTTEGVANLNKWKNSIAETERLRNAYEQSRLLGLKGQMNPHFLFNCFNTLSELISDSEAEPEQFLEEMVKVHRYLLRNTNDYLVPVAEEIKFAQSYLFLAKVRFGNAIQASINISSEVSEKFIPPLSMQVILENIIYSNAINKANPLMIKITNTDTNQLFISHSVHEKTITHGFDLYEGFDNLVNKYRLLNAPPIHIREKAYQRTILLPILEQGELAL